MTFGGRRLFGSLHVTTSGETTLIQKSHNGTRYIFQVLQLLQSGRNGGAAAARRVPYTACIRLPRQSSALNEHVTRGRNNRLGSQASGNDGPMRASEQRACSLEGEGLEMVEGRPVAREDEPLVHGIVTWLLRHRLH